MTPDDPTRTSPPDATRDQADAALDAGLAAAFGGETTHLRPPPADPEAGTVIAGKYRLTERIGEGGMGSVWAATQTEPVKRKVAVKLIKAGMDSKAVLARFEAERQALAVMDHPSIAKVLDGGLHDGRPYFVMELVKGVPITQYCDERKLTPAQRLELFVPVCQAIQHAHQKGVIHRDIKPSNVLVALYDDKPVPKVIDFGIAKATGAALTEHTLETGFGAVVGTPAYMSPEQASLNNLDIDTRSDVYALGVLLYELLTGSPPFSGKELQKRGLLEMLRVVREEEPPRPSAKLSTADALPTLSANRGTEPKKLTGLLRSELDWVVMKALEKDRARRYETANGFAADVLRFLSGEAVQAHPPSAAYRLKKFVRRNRVQVTAAAVVLLTLLLGIAGTTFGLIQAEQRRVDAEQAKQREAEERTKAEERAAESDAVVKFFQNRVFLAATPKGFDHGLGADVTLLEAITASLPDLDTSFRQQPLVEARLRLAVGSTLSELGLAEKGAFQSERARQMYSRLLGPDHPNTLASMNNLAKCYNGLNRPAEALKLFEEVLTAQRRGLPPDHPDTLNTLVGIANCYGKLNRPAEALKLHETILATRRRDLPPDHPDILTGMGGVAFSYWRLNRRAEAILMLQETLAVARRVYTRDHPSLLLMLDNLGVFLGQVNRHSEAVEVVQEVLEARQRIYPPDHPTTLNSLSNLAGLYAYLNRHTEAVKVAEAALAGAKRVLPADHEHTLAIMANLAYSYSALGRHDDAVPLIRDAVAGHERTHSKSHPKTLFAMWTQVELLFAADRSAEAVAVIDECIRRVPGQVVDPGLVPDVMNYRLRHFKQATDPAGCRATAEMWEKLNRPDADSLYTAARFRAVAAGQYARGQRPAEGAADAGRAMEWLAKAVKAGFKNHAHMKKDTDLDTLREREDFKKLLADLEAKFPPKKDPPPPEKK